MKLERIEGRYPLARALKKGRLPECKQPSDKFLYSQPHPHLKLSRSNRHLISALGEDDEADCDPNEGLNEHWQKLP